MGKGQIIEKVVAYFPCICGLEWTPNSATLVYVECKVTFTNYRVA